MSAQGGWFAYGGEGSSSPYVSQVSFGFPDQDPDRRRGDATPELADVGRLARRAVRGVVRAARKQDGPVEEIAGLLHEHLGSDRTSELPVVTESWAGYDHVNVQAGLDAWLGGPGREHSLHGLVGYQHRMFGLAEMLAGGDQMMGMSWGSVARTNLTAGPDGEVRSCVRCAVALVTGDGAPMVMFLRGPEPESGHSMVTLQIAGADEEQVMAAAAAVRRLTVEHNVFRGQVLTFGGDVFGHGQTLLQFHRRPAITEADLILPPGTLAAVRRQVVEVARHKERLLAAGQHLKRGVLLYGPPGVGKTHTVRYLTAEATGTTVLQLTVDSLGMLAEACSIARTLQPSMLVVEDVDLIAQDRDFRSGENPMMFQLLNEMDGLGEDADVVFVLTTNRADLLEPALAARPGRIDQAVELTLPDADARRRLFALYRGRLAVDESRLDDVIAGTEGVTASFLKELLRRSALIAAAARPGEGAIQVGADDLDAALAELLDVRNAMTAALLGGARDGGWEEEPEVEPEDF